MISPRRIAILFSDTGGGHRSAAQAVCTALQDRYGAEVEVQMVDVLKHHTPYPLNRIPAWYPKMVPSPELWAAGFDLTNKTNRVQTIAGSLRPYVRERAQRFVDEHPADVYVSVHPLLGALILEALGHRRPPFITIVTDLATVHAAWCHPEADLYIVPTEPARECIVGFGVKPKRIQLLGMPVSSDFVTPVAEKAALRSGLGWSLDRPVVLLMGGGEGMGPLSVIAQAVASSGLACELVIVTGRNQALRDQLSTLHWDIPVHVYGFVSTMPDFMYAADVLLTKAGTATLCEAFCAGLPTIIYSYIPGQETGNVVYAVEGGAAILAPGPERTVEALRRWIGPEAEPGALACTADNVRRLARPNAANDIADVIWRMAGARQRGESVGNMFDLTLEGG